MSVRSKEYAKQKKVDRLGIMASGMCTLHCILCVVLPMAWGMWGLGFVMAEEVEWALTLLAVTLALATFWLGWRRHRSNRLALLFAVGVVLLLSSRLVEQVGGHEHVDHEHAHHAMVSPHSEDEHASVDDEHRAADGAKNAHEEDENPWHHLGAVMGIIAGALLFTGHMVSLRMGSAMCQGESCE